MTAKKTIDLAKKMERRKYQLTELKSNVAMDMKIKQGNENVPRKVLRPLPSVGEITFSLPAT